MSNSEIERKFLLSALPDNLEQYPHKAISQGYITTDSSNEVRVRSKGKEHFLTIKQGDGLHRTEVEISLTEKQFSELWGLTQNQRMNKVRYDYPYFETVIEIDVYSNALAPLIVAEVEFNSIEESHAFSLPAFLGREVTQDRSYKNASLVVHGLPESYNRETACGILK